MGIHKFIVGIILICASLHSIDSHSSEISTPSLDDRGPLKLAPPNRYEIFKLSHDISRRGQHLSSVIFIDRDESKIYQCSSSVDTTIVYVDCHKQKSGGDLSSAKFLVFEKDKLNSTAATRREAIWFVDGAGILTFCVLSDTRELICKQASFN